MKSKLKKSTWLKLIAAITLNPFSIAAASVPSSSSSSSSGRDDRGGEVAVAGERAYYPHTSQASNSDQAQVTPSSNVDQNQLIQQVKGTVDQIHAHLLSFFNQIENNYPTDRQEFNHYQTTYLLTQITDANFNQVYINGKKPYDVVVDQLVQIINLNITNGVFLNKSEANLGFNQVPLPYLFNEDHAHEFDQQLAERNYYVRLNNVQPYLYQPNTYNSATGRNHGPKYQAYNEKNGATPIKLGNQLINTLTLDQKQHFIQQFLSGLVSEFAKHNDQFGYSWYLQIPESLKLNYSLTDRSYATNDYTNLIAALFTKTANSPLIENNFGLKKIFQEIKKELQKQLNQAQRELDSLAGQANLFIDGSQSKFFQYDSHSNQKAWNLFFSSVPEISLNTTLIRQRNLTYPVVLRGLEIVPKTKSNINSYLCEFNRYMDCDDDGYDLINVQPTLKFLLTSGNATYYYDGSINNRDDAKANHAHYLTPYQIVTNEQANRASVAKLMRDYLTEQLRSNAKAWINVPQNDFQHNAPLGIDPYSLNFNPKARKLFSEFRISPWYDYYRLGLSGYSRLQIVNAPTNRANNGNDYPFYIPYFKIYDPYPDSDVQNDFYQDNAIGHLETGITNAAWALQYAPTITPLYAGPWSKSSSVQDALDAIHQDLYPQSRKAGDEASHILKYNLPEKIFDFNQYQSFFLHNGYLRYWPVSIQPITLETFDSPLSDEAHTSEGGVSLRISKSNLRAQLQSFGPDAKVLLVKTRVTYNGIYKTPNDTSFEYYSLVNLNQERTTFSEFSTKAQADGEKLWTQYQSLYGKDLVKDQYKPQFDRLVNKAIVKTTNDPQFFNNSLNTNLNHFRTNLMQMIQAGFYYLPLSSANRSYLNEAINEQFKKNQAKLAELLKASGVAKNQNVATNYQEQLTKAKEQILKLLQGPNAALVDPSLINPDTLKLLAILNNLKPNAALQLSQLIHKTDPKTLFNAYHQLNTVTTYTLTGVSAGTLIVLGLAFMRVYQIDPKRLALNKRMLFSIIIGAGIITLVVLSYLTASLFI